ncbi:MULTISPECIES: response regulator transcription factor [Dellaglioa]|uniref:DNA-binding response regulator n=2 Tax=Dellaglioa TaxID=2767880 RepID=A0A2C8ETW8_9LACO|nr:MULTISPECIES: response regulator transcription factor [Dellaglioa]MCZ2491813.1 response regulator transcription factor [Dellaglioa carnosa]MCZ2492985.1 response regulator transcription factor [Dellaglioa carnosa]MCZ2494971.1 response regulator transcription factor [Dellaglioa carnosa]MDK1717238.1 response regulator transcription factor [Dellaglioa algida]MDK1719168.1 response regulator transcription factor [Dellaglioa algida]
MFNIMIVEDDKTIANITADSLAKWRFNPILTNDFSKIDLEFIEKKPHLVLLDINLPDFDGFYWCKKIRETSNVPIIFISSRNTNMDMVMAMNMGGDDFVSKPYSMEVLVAKISALLRRTYNYVEMGPETLEHNGLFLNLQNGTAKFNDEIIDLSKNEYQLLQYLMRQTGKIVSREKLLRELWEDEHFVDDNTLTVNINRVRKKIAHAGLPNFIETKVGQGYIIP